MILGITISLIVATLLLFILILSLYSRHLANRDIRLLNCIAKKYAGKISVNSFNSSTTIDFPYHGSKIKFFQRKGLSNKTTRLCLCCDVDFSNSLSMHIAKTSMADKSISEHKHFMFVPIVVVGSDRFSQEFKVRANNQSFITALLSDHFQKQILSMAPSDPILYLHTSNEPLSRIKGVKDTAHSLELSINQPLKRKEDIEAFLESGLSLVRPLLGSNGLE
jgi:hypothetical protein